MAYILRYRCEFDTIKGRQVKIDIEKERNIISPIIFQPIVAASVFSSANNSLVTGTQALTFLEVGDIITITGTANNNKTFTLKDFSYTTAGFGSTTLFFNESVIDETD
jgi:hypothetical protein